MIAAASHQLYDTFPGHTANPNNNPSVPSPLPVLPSSR